MGFIAVFASCYAAGAAALQLQNAGKPRDKAMPAPWETTSHFSALKQNSYRGRSRPRAAPDRM